MINEIDKVLYTAKTHTTGGRDGAGKSSDGALDVKLSSPGSNRPGTNPEQLFAVGWSACFMGAIGLAAKARADRAQQLCPAAPDLAEAPAPLFRPVAAAAVAIERRRHRAGSMAAGSSVPAAAVTAVRRGRDSRAVGTEAVGCPAHRLAGAAEDR